MVQIDRFLALKGGVGVACVVGWGGESFLHSLLASLHKVDTHHVFLLLLAVVVSWTFQLLEVRLELRNHRLFIIALLGSLSSHFGRICW